MTEGKRAGSVAVRAVLLLTLTLTLLFGWQRLTVTVTSSHGAYPLAAARFVSGLAGAFPGRECVLAADGLPAGLADDLNFQPGATPGPFNRAVPGIDEVRIGSWVPAPAIWLLGSGLRHHYALQAIQDDYLVINFDAHADMRSGGDVDCGNWLRHWLEARPDRQAMVLGVSAMLGGETWLGQATDFLPLPLITEGRAQLWPLSARRSYFRTSGLEVTNNPSVAARGGGWVEWRSLDEWRVPPPHRAAAVTVDLDCLTERGFAAEWVTGELPLPRLLSLLRELAGKTKITSVSICGFSPTQTETERAALVAVLRDIVAATEQKP